MPVLLKRLGNIVTTALLVGSADTAEWYYADVQEATNSHNYDPKYDKDGNVYEVWTGLRPVRDWAALERAWSEANSSESPGEVVSSNTSSVFGD